MLAGIVKKESVTIAQVAENLSEPEAFKIESELIAQYGRADRGGILVNLTDGGDGVVGHKRTPEQRMALSVARKGNTFLSPEARAKISAALKGRPKSPEHIAAARAAKKGVKLGPWSEARRAAHKPRLGRKMSPAHYAAHLAGIHAMTDEQRRLKSERIIKALTGKSHSVETCKAISVAQHNMSDEAKKKKAALLSAALTGRKASAETIEKMTLKLDSVAIAKAYRDGESVNEIAFRFGVSNCAIDRRLQKEGVVMRDRIAALRLKNSRKLTAA